MTVRKLLLLLLFLDFMFVPFAPCGGRDARAAVQALPSWGDAMTRVHARFHGKPGTFAQFGDSITDSLAFWTPLKYERKNASAEMERAFRMVNAHLRPECWRDWKGPQYGNQGGQTARWADDNVASWLEKLDPEVALIMFGTNDLRDFDVAEYRRRLRSVIRKCLNHGTVVILSTIPPRHGFVSTAASFAEAARQVARELQVPLVDYHAEILRRRPGDWDGAAEPFRAYEGYNVPTLIARDGVHPSAPRQYQNDYSDEALRCNGYNLRNYLVLMKSAEVIDAILAPGLSSDPSGPLSAKEW